MSEEKTNSLQKIKSQATLLTQKATAHRFTIIFIILGAAIGFALIRTQSFLSIPRNEERYSEEVVKINYKKIDSEILNQFKDAQADTDIEVDSDFATDRNDPFSE